MEEIERVRNILKKVKKDCQELKKKGLLTKRGMGHLDIVRIIEEEL